jgi:hypothetical protein
MKNKLLSVLLAVFVIGVLVLSGPANAVSVSLNTADSSPTAGDIVTLTGEFSVEVDENIPVSNVDVRINDQRCYFTPEGQLENAPGSICDKVSIIRESGDNYGYGYGYGTTPSLRYLINWDTTGASGTQDVIFNVNTGSRTYSSETQTFTFGTPTTPTGNDTGGSDTPPINTGSFDVIVYDITATSASFNATYPGIVTYDLFWGTVDEFSYGHIHGGTTYDTHLIARELMPATTYQFLFNACDGSGCMNYRSSFTTLG